MQRVYQLLEQNGLSGSYFAGQQNQPLVGLNAEQEFGKGLFSLRSAEQVVRVRDNIEGIIREAEKLLIHDRPIEFPFSSSPKSARANPAYQLNAFPQSP